MSHILPWLLEIIPFLFSIFVQYTSNLSDNLIRVLLTQAIQKHYPSVPDPIKDTLAGFVLDINQRFTFLVAILTSFVFSIVIGLQKDSPMFIVGGGTLVVAAVLVTILHIWALPVGQISTNKPLFNKPTSYWLKAIMLFFNTGFILGLAWFHFCQISSSDVKG